MTDTPSDAGSFATPGTTRPGTRGCVVFLVDETPAMEARVAGGTKSKAESAATALNSLLAQMAAGPDVDVAVVGYRTAPAGGADVGCRWAGALAGRSLVNTSELAASPLEVEHRTRRVPGPGGLGVVREETVPFPIWYRPALGGAYPRRPAMLECVEILSRWQAVAAASVKPPLVVHLLGELAPEGPLGEVLDRLDRLATAEGPPLLVNAHLGTSTRIPATLYPSGELHLPPGAARELFDASSPLDGPLAAALIQAQVKIRPNAHGLILNAQMADLIRFLWLVKAYAAWQPEYSSDAGAPLAGDAAENTSQGSALATENAPSPPPSSGVPPPSDRSLLLLLLLDRSLESPSQAPARNAWSRLQDHANELLAQIARRGGGRIDTAVFTYGADGAGRAAVEPGLSGPWAERPWVNDTELSAAALRIDQVTEQASNGIGGLVTLNRKRPVFVERPPGQACDPLPAFEAVRSRIGDWRAGHPGARPPVVLHLTRGRPRPDELERAASLLAGAAVLAHLVVTESPHRSLAYPADAAGIETAELTRLWQSSGLLPGRESLAARRPGLSPQARAMVVNGKFDLLLDGFEVL